MYRDDRGDRDFRGGHSNGGGYGNNNSSMQNRFAPVKEGDELDVKIETVGEKGDGIAKKQGFVLFVPKTKTGDEVRVRVTRVLKNAGFAEVIGQAQSTPAPSSPAAPQKKKEEEFNPSTEDDSENFGEEAEATAEKSDDDLDDNAEEVQED